ncbi:hypothetical protein [uncultured Alistipes sp.]|uniref:hypothetical protein n=1 Tax=uncultured Alistipes sp. TaxID=538949 RepID=UPI00262363E0|nr:hypothetical protein [uncultured Alistipes sp.]
MCKSDVFNRVLDIVSRETEIDASEILGKGRTIEVVDARSILFKILREEGMYPSQIANKAHKTSAAVRYLLADFQERVEANPMIEKTWKKVRKKLENN